MPGSPGAGGMIHPGGASRPQEESGQDHRYRRGRKVWSGSYSPAPDQEEEPGDDHPPFIDSSIDHPGGFPSFLRDRSRGHRDWIPGGRLSAIQPGMAPIGGRARMPDWNKFISGASGSPGRPASGSGATVSSGPPGGDAPGAHLGRVFLFGGGLNPFWVLDRIGEGGGDGPVEGGFGGPVKRTPAPGGY